MMNLYGDDRYVYGEEQNSQYKKGHITEKILDALAYLSPVYHAEAIARNVRVKKIENAISKVDVTDTENLKKINNTITKYDLENNTFGKAIKQKYIEQFVAKVINNNNNILSQDMIDYYLERSKNHNNEQNAKRKQNKVSAKIKAKIKETYESSNLHRSLMAKKVAKEIEEVQPENTEKLKEIFNTIVAHDFDSSQFGKYLTDETLKTFVEKVEKNGKEIVSQDHLNFIKNSYNDNENKQILNEDDLKL